MTEQEKLLSQESFIDWLTRKPNGQAAMMGLADNAQESAFIVDVLSERNEELLINWICTKEARQEKLVAMAAEIDDASDLIRILLSAGTTYVALIPKDRGQQDSLIDPGSIRFEDRKNIRQNYELFFAKQIDPDGALHSNHLYVAARCLSVAKKVDTQWRNLIFDRLLIEFDLEVAPPEKAIGAFAQMANMAIEPLMNFIKDSSRDTFSREDAALALGAIGNDTVVHSLGDWLKNIESRDSAIPLYALGRTNNKKAIPLIEAWVKNNQGHEKIWVAQEALAKLKMN